MKSSDVPLLSQLIHISQDTLTKGRLIEIWNKEFMPVPDIESMQNVEGQVLKGHMDNASLNTLRILKNFLKGYAPYLAN